MKNLCLNIAVALAVMNIGQTVLAQEMASHADALLAKYSEHQITTEVIADQAIADAEHETTYINARLTEQERGCYDQFFTNSCLDNVREEYRQSAKKIRSVTVYANRFKRQLKADRGDQQIKADQTDSQ